MKSNKVSVGKTNLAILNGTEDLSVWSEEELLRGQRRDRNGRWAGRPPKVVPLRVHEELTRRRLDKAYELLRDNLVAAVEVLGEVVQDKKAAPKDRLRAAELIMERVMGKAPMKVEVGVKTKFDLALEAMIVWEDGYNPDAIDAESWEADEA
ncbi:MAG TPA: hypothetical protein VHA73_14360 [Acidimicrobiales bacterium]|nr:hypothetical protein [Acidimicrobiales bacterium]